MIAVQYYFLRTVYCCGALLSPPPLPFTLTPQAEQSVRPAYLQGREITGNMRAILIDWLVQVSLKFRLLQETMYMTVAIIDRFLQVRCNFNAL